MDEDESFEWDETEPEVPVPVTRAGTTVGDDCDDCDGVSEGDSITVATTMLVLVMGWLEMKVSVLNASTVATALTTLVLVSEGDQKA